MKELTRRHGDGGTRRTVTRLGVYALGLCVALLSLTLTFTSGAQTRGRSGAHATAPETFTAADRTTVERAIGSACAERIRDPLGSTPIDVMQARPSMSVNHPDALAGARRANRLLPTTRKRVSDAIVQF